MTKIKIISLAGFCLKLTNFLVIMALNIPKAIPMTILAIERTIKLRIECQISLPVIYFILSNLPY